MIDHLWQSTLFAAAVGVATLALGRHDAAVRYRLWLAASVKFLVPFSLLTSLGAHLTWRTAPASAASWPIVVEQVFSPQAHGTLPSAANVAAPHPSLVPITLMAIWALGTTAVLFAWWRQWRAIRRTVNRATPARLNVSDVLDAPVLLSSDGIEPGLVGVWHPVLLLPANIETCVSPEGLNAILAHEACHLRRRDNLTAALHMAVEAIFWFHPGVWWIEARLVDERERACDEAVLRAGAPPRAYAEAILSVCRYYTESPLIAASGVTGANLTRRIERILSDTCERPLTRMMSTALGVLAASIVVGPVALGAMVAARPANATSQAATAPAGPLSFQAASIKPNPSVTGDRGAGFQPGGRFVARNMPLRSLIAIAYGEPAPLPLIRIVGGPDWLDSDRFDIEAKAEGNFPETVSQVGFSTSGELMLRTLLAERFKLAARVEPREMPVYSMVQIRRDRRLSGLVVSTGTDCATPPTPAAGVLPPCGLQFVPDAEVNIRHYRARHITMDDLARSFSGFIGTGIDRFIVNQSGLDGAFSFDLRFSPPAAGGSPDMGISIFSAFQEQLGLRLEATRAPVNVLVIDHADRLQDESEPVATASAVVTSFQPRPPVASKVAAQATTATIIGLVTDSTSNEPLAGVVVEVATEDPPNNPRTVETGADGTFPIGELPEGVYIVTFHHDEYTTFKREGLKVDAGATVKVAVAMRFSPIRD